MTPYRQVQTALQEPLSVASIPIHELEGPAGPTTTPAQPGFDPAYPAFVADIWLLCGLHSLPVLV